MKVLLVSPNTESLGMPVVPAGMHLVADAVKRSGHEIFTLDMFEHQDPWSAIEHCILEEGPDLVGVSVRNIDDQTMDAPQFLLQGSREVVQGLRRLTSAPLLIGGAGYSLYPLSSLTYLGADMGLSGEGELTLPALLQAMEGKRGLDSVPGLHLPEKGRVGPRALIRDLDSCPLPRPENLGLDRMERDDFWLPFQTRRGCPLDCSYCSTGSIEGRRIRKRSVARVVASLEEFEQAGVRKVFFVDNTFNLPAGYARRLCQSMLEAGLSLKWCAIVYPMSIDAGMANLMARAGCIQVSLGFESCSPAILSSLNKRFSREEVRRVSESFKRAGIRRMGFLLLGAPGETEDSVRESLDFAEALGLEALKITVGVRVYPGTRLARQAVNAGLIRPDDTLLEPRFYLEPNLASWLPEFVQGWSSDRADLVV